MEQPAAPGVPGALIDNHGRRITYLRLAITDRCNLRCRYCMPEQGVDFVPHHEILTFEEMERLLYLLAQMGITKVRFTGGEPLVRSGAVDFFRRAARVPGIDSLHLTTNGVALAEHLGALAEIGLKGINLSLDTLERERFKHLCRRDYFPRVWDAFTGTLARGISLKVNSVVQDDTTDGEILSLADLADRYDISVRFIEKMAFSGGKNHPGGEFGRLRERLFGLFPGMVELAGSSPSTARLYTLLGRRGRIGVIEGYSRRFCATCNKIRITPQGLLKTCLYDNGVLDLKSLLRSGADDLEVETAIRAAVGVRFADGMATEAAIVRDCEPSMASIGG